MVGRSFPYVVGGLKDPPFIFKEIMMSKIRKITVGCEVPVQITQFQILKFKTSVEVELEPTDTPEEEAEEKKNAVLKARSLIFNHFQVLGDEKTYTKIDKFMNDVLEKAKILNARKK